MKGKTTQGIRGRSYRGSKSKKQMLRKEEQKRTKYETKPTCYAQFYGKQYGQRGA